MTFAKTVARDVPMIGASSEFLMPRPAASARTAAAIRWSADGERLDWASTASDMGPS